MKCLLNEQRDLSVVDVRKREKTYQNSDGNLRCLECRIRRGTAKEGEAESWNQKPEREHAFPSWCCAQCVDTAQKNLTQVVSSCKGLLSYSFKSSRLR